MYGYKFGLLNGIFNHNDVSTPTYYISPSGSDSNDGLSSGGAIATISKLNTLTLSPGDIVGFEKGGIYEGTITVGQSGSSGNPITFTSYGTGDKPKIYGSEVITGWTKHSGNIYKASFKTDISQLFVNGVKMKLARLTNTGYNLVTGFSSRSVFTIDATSQTSNYYTGCYVLTRTENWFSEMRTISSSTGNTLTLNSAVSSDFNTGEGVILMNKLEFLDSPGEWYYDTSTNTVYLWKLDSTEPTDTEVRGSTISNGIDVNTKSYITIQNLEILHQKNNGISATGVGSSTGNVFSNNTISGQEQAGIFGHVTDAQNITVTNNIISNCNDAGIYFRNIGNSIIQDNSISNIGLIYEIGTLGTGEQGNGSGIACIVGDASGKNYIKYNNIQNLNYNGIRFTGLSDIQYNYIKNCLIHKADGAGIYTETAAGSVISYNIVENSIGSVEGRPAGSLTFGQGIYTDEVASNIIVERNSIMNVSHAGIYTNRVDNCTYQYNKVLNARYGINKVNYSGTTPSIINYNTFITGSATDDYEPRQLVARYGDGNATFNNNTYINGFTSDLVFRGTDDGYKNFTDWKTNISGDAASTYIGTDLLANETQRLVYNNSKTVKTFYLNAATNVKDENGTTVSSGFTVQPFESKYVRGLNVDCIQDYSESTIPVITAFVIPATNESLIVPITAFTATDNTEVAKYLINQSATTPALTAAGWTSTVPTTYTASGGGSITLYAWVRDAAGNISSSVSDNITITLPDYTATLTNGLLVAYDFEETSGLLQDLSGNARHATAQGANITINQAGNPGQSYLFNGTTFSDARISIADNNVLSFIDSMGVYFWLKLNTIDKAHAIVYKGTGTGPAYEYMIKVTSGNKIQFNIFQNGTSTNMQAVGSTSLLADTEYMIECSATDILDRSTMKISINKVDETLTLSGNSTITNVVNGAGLYYIGGESFVGSWLNGNISQLLMYDRVLTNEEKIGLYGDGSGINKADW